MYQALSVGSERIRKGLILREEESELYLYRQDVYQDERLIESVMRELAGRPNRLPRDHRKPLGDLPARREQSSGTTLPIRL